MQWQPKHYFILGVVLNTLISCSTTGGEQQKSGGDAWWHQPARRMVREQIYDRGVRDSLVLKVMENTPRHLFVPEAFRPEAYADYPLTIGFGQTISQPYIVALMTELLQLQGHETVLEIGTGSGYQAAVLAPLCRSVYSIEIVRELANSAQARLQKMGYHNIHVKWGDGYQGWPEHAPFDAIIVTAAPEQIPPALIQQLKAGGRMVLPVGSYYQELLVITKNAKGEVRRENIIPVRFVPMVHPEKPIPEELPQQ